MNKQEQLKYIEDNYPLTTHHISNRRIRHSFFSKIETELQAYLLGFYASDGSINEKRKTLRVHLQIQDKEIVYLFKDVISPDARTFSIDPKIVTGRNGMKIQGHESFGVDITSSEICNSLVDLGIGYNKTYSDLKIPNKIPNNLVRHFIRGYFDGDGCITGYVPNEPNKNPRFRIRFDIDAKKQSILLDFAKFFSENNINVNINYLKRDDMYRLTIGSKKEIYKIFELLYKDCNFCLSRKFNKFNHYVNTEVTQLIAEYRNAQEVNVNESNNPPKSVEQVTKSYLDDEYIENNYFEYLENVR